MRRVALVAGVIAAAGCRQLFGIDDTAVADDADDANAPDGGGDGPVATGPCSGTHLFCADFDSPMTGLAQLQSTIVGGILEERQSPIAVSPPRILLAGVPVGATTATAIAFAALPGSSRVRAEAWVSVTGTTTNCQPTVLTLYAETEPAGVALIITPMGYELQSFASNGEQMQLQFGAPIAGMHHISLELDATTGDSQATAGSFAAYQELPAIATIAPVDLLGLGVGASGSHAACEISVDNLVVDRVNPMM